MQIVSKRDSLNEMSNSVGWKKKEKKKKKKRKKKKRKVSSNILSVEIA